MQSNKFLKASLTPDKDLAIVSIPNIGNTLTQYRKNYERFFDMMPILFLNDLLFSLKAILSGAVMKQLGRQILQDGWLKVKEQENDKFSRSIVGLESPIVNEDGEIKQGAEFLVAHWGKGFTSPVHGHAPGFQYEEVLSGKIRVNTYRIINAVERIVRFVETKIVEVGTFVSEYIPKTNDIVRGELIHNFTALEPSHTLHYLSEHSRNGKDNGFSVQMFEQEYNLDNQDVKQISTMDAIYAPNGTVILVRSTNVPEYSDHYIVITGPPIMKHNGLRPQEFAIGAPNASTLLDQYEPHTGVILLRLTSHAAEAFLDFHSIKVEGKNVLVDQNSETISI